MDLFQKSKFFLWLFFTEIVRKKSFLDILDREKEKRILQIHSLIQEFIYLLIYKLRQEAWITHRVSN